MSTPAAPVQGTALDTTPRRPDITPAQMVSGIPIIA
jgi:hypothetical protein